MNGEKSIMPAVIIPKTHKPVTGRLHGQRGPDYTPHIRGAVVRALKILEDDGTPLSVLIAQGLHENVIGMLAVLQRWAPNDIMASAGEQGGQITVVFGTPVDQIDEAEVRAIAGDIDDLLA